MEAMEVPWSGRRKRRHKRNRAEGIVHFLIVVWNLILSFVSVLRSTDEPVSLRYGFSGFYTKKKTSSSIDGDRELHGSLTLDWLWFCHHGQINGWWFVCRNVASCYWLLFVSLTWLKPRVFGRPHRRLATASVIDRLTIYAASMDDPTATSWLSDVACFYWSASSTWRGEIKCLAPPLRPCLVAGIRCSIFTLSTACVWLMINPN